MSIRPPSTSVLKAQAGGERGLEKEREVVFKKAEWTEVEATQETAAWLVHAPFVGFRKGLGQELVSLKGVAT